ncbi:ATP-binding protein [Piscinibacter sp. HJYY11]|uniref:hybrid sensor histidine kinase/response regulator n=1 Tax=Piscinibacter sp. HJYY11 TaxID=2801333 RepID=UPI00191D4CEC|nr:ATP-binding protein [Piscinibacter sp. HJYY11]MBL0726151.1 response regulator [Piscinibacter sp. HJYY11]
MPLLPPSIYKAVFDGSPIGEYLLSPSDDPVILAVNDAFLKASARTRESLLGQHLFVAFPGNPDDTGDTGVAALRASLAHVIATGQSQSMALQRYPVRVTQPDGTEVFEERYWHAVNIPIFDGSGELVCIAHRTEDVTESQRVSEALARSADRQEFQLRLVDRLRHLTSPDDIAAAATSMLGARLNIKRATYVEVDDVAGTFVQRHWVGESGAEPVSERRHLEDFGAEIVATLRRGEPLVIVDVRTDPRTREQAAAYANIGVRSNLAIPLVKAGRLTLVLSLQHDEPRTWHDAEIDLAIDVAERTWASAENARAQVELREGHRRKDEFLAMLAHELRNPLAPIRVAAELLVRGQLDEHRLQKTSAIIARQVRHMSGLVDDLLDVSRVTRGVVTLDESPQDMKTVLANASEQVRPLMEVNRHQVTLDLPPEATFVCGDGKRLVQVVGNLLINAAKFTPPGGHIHIGLTMKGDEVLVRVTDDGIGIPKDLQLRIFDLFSQAERSPDRSQGGLGLGLALVKSLVEQHKGTVSVFSEGAGTGSRFTISLPLLKSRKPWPISEAGAPEPSPSRSLDVLVVDDNEDAAETLRLLLEDAGHRVRVEHDPHRALHVSAEHPPEVGLIDIGLPSMDGYEVVRRLRARADTAQGRYVAVTGYGQESDRRRALDSGFDEHIVKPADPQTLLSLLARLAGQGGRR